MTRIESIEYQKKIKSLCKEFGKYGHERVDGGYSNYHIESVLKISVPNELKLIGILKYFQGLKSAKDAEIEKAKSELTK
jgi:hypothetical protein